MSSPQTKVVFPPPPPTTNCLTSHQRNQLLRKTKKLEQILGAAPHLVDEVSAEAIAPIPTTTTPRPGSISRRARSSADSSTSSASSNGSSPTLRRTSSTTSSYHSTGRPVSTLRKANPAARQASPTPSTPDYEDWTARKPPFLRLALENPNPCPQNLSASISCPLSEETRALEDLGATNLHRRYSLSPTVPRTAKEITDSVTFISPLCSTRKSKMDRVVRKLGRGVPIELVFPEGSFDSDETGSPVSPNSADGFAIPLEPRRRTKRALGTIAGARDSLTEEGIHRARRQQAPPLKTKISIPCVHASASMPAWRKQDEKLVAIVESPDEHGVGRGEGFGMSRSYSERACYLLHVRDDDAEIKFWSTRKGYEGWAPPVPQKDSRSWTSRKAMPSFDRLL